MKEKSTLIIGIAAFTFALWNVSVAEGGAAPVPHRSGGNSLVSTMAPGSTAAMKPDQVNTDGWDKAWTNLVNDVEQTFTPSLPRLLAVEVELVAGNPGRGKGGSTEDELTLIVLDKAGETVALVTQTVNESNCDHAMFLIPKDGMEVTPGESYRIRLTGGTTFGWKYVVGGYPKGAATFNGKPLLPTARSTFLFRTFGSN